MVLNNVTIIGKEKPTDIQIRGSRIKTIEKQTAAPKPGRLQLNFQNTLAFPGLINAHDHLDFNLFPQLGHKTYKNYTDWGKHIHEQYKDEIAEVLNVPLPLREQWGMIKNLLCGVTTVIHHGAKITTDFKPVNVFEQYQCLHSVNLEKRWRLKLNNPLKMKLPVIIHTGEGTDSSSHDEIDQLIRWNLLRRPLIGVHAVSMSRKQAAKFKAIVWCPESNYFMFNKTADIEKLKKITTIFFGTDSTLTGSWNIWDHIQMARETRQLSDKDLYNSLTINSSTLLQTSSAKLGNSRKADIVLTKMQPGEATDTAFFNTRPENISLVLCDGNIRLFDDELLPQLQNTDLSNFSKIYIKGACKYIQGDIPALVKEIKQYYPKAKFPITTD